MEEYKVGNIYYHEPEDNFRKVNFEVIRNFDCLTVGLYCKIIAMSAEWKLNIVGLASVLDISKDKVKLSIQKLERDGFMKRVPVKNENGKFAGYSYHFYPMPIPEEERTMAGYPKNGVPEERGTRKMGYPENGTPNNNRKENNNRLKKVDDKTSTKKRFIKPTIEEIDAYIKEKGYKFSAEAFYFHYESKGWMVGKNKMTNWKSACSTWEILRKQREEKENNKETDEIPDERKAGWERSKEWMHKFIPRIADRISFTDFDTMRGTVYHNREVFSDILQEINNSDYEGDIVAEFCRLSQTDRYNQKLFEV